MAGEEEGLDVGDEADGDGLAEEGVGDLVALAFLVGLEDGAPGVVGKADAAGGIGGEVGGADLGAVDESEGETVGQAGAEFLHEVEGERGASGAEGVEEADGGVEPDAFEGAGDVVGEEDVEEGEEGVDGIARWPPVASGEGEGGIVVGDEVREGGEVELGGLSFDAADAVGGVGLAQAVEGQGELLAGGAEEGGGGGVGAVAGPRG